MTHMGPMPESSGQLSEAKVREELPCRRCKETGCVAMQIWESSCGGYEDLKFTCLACGKVWWVDGIDS